jgi:hypothetical protein
MAHSIDVSKAYRATATETGLYLDTSRIQSDLTVDIIITYKNYAGEQTVDIGSKQTLESVVGLFTQVVVDGKATYRFPVLKTVAPGTTVTLDLDQNSLAASFTNLAGRRTRSPSSSRRRSTWKPRGVHQSTPDCSSRRLTFAMA